MGITNLKGVMGCQGQTGENTRFKIEDARSKTRVFKAQCCVYCSLPKGPFRTKNAIALKSVVKYYRGSILLSVPIRCRFSQEKKHPNYVRGSELLSR